MPYLDSIQDWLRQSDLLIRAYPTSTRITTKYSIPSPSSSSSSSSSKQRKRKRTTPSATADAPSTSTGANAAQQTQPRATLTLKTYDPVSGTCLKYKTDQAAEANRLARSLGALGRSMASLEVDVGSVLDGPAVEPVQESAATVSTGGGAGVGGKEGGKVGDATASAGGGEGGGKRKKKKGKK